MPAPSSAMVTVRADSEPSADPSAVRPGDGDTAMRTRVAPARRLFCRVSAKMSASVAA